MKKNWRFVCLLFIFFAGVLPSESSVNIGVVDMDAVFSSYDRAHGVSLEVRALAREVVPEREKLREQINMVERKLREETNEVEIENLAGELKEKINMYREFDRVQQEKESEPVQFALRYIYQKVEEFAKTNAFDLIIEKRAGIFGRTVLFSSTKLDITEDIIKIL